MLAYLSNSALILVLNTALVAAVVIRVLLRPNREPGSRIAWVVGIIAVPLVGIAAYVLFGEVNIGKARVHRKRRVLEAMPDVAGPEVGDESNFAAALPEHYRHLFQVASSINPLTPVGGNHGHLLRDSNAAIEAMVTDIDYEYGDGLLHTKSLTLDGDITLIGSANMDRRSFDLNYENNILLYDPALTAQLRERQADYIAASQRVTPEMVAGWPIRRRLWNNAIATLGPIL